MARRRVMTRHGTALKTRPLLCQVCTHHVWADPVSLPFPDASFAFISCLDILAYVRDDEATIRELARVLAPNGKLLLRVPNQGVTAGLDAFNLYRYFSDGTRRGSRPPETDELGWRRHFREGELADLLESAGLRIEEEWTTGTGLPELAQFAAMFGFRWLKPSEGRYQRLVTIIDRARQSDNRIPTPGFGFSRSILAVRE
jgi:SAM-dependent methyltransferase